MGGLRTVCRSRSASLLVAAVSIAGLNLLFGFAPTIRRERAPDIIALFKPALFATAHEPLIATCVDELAFAPRFLDFRFVAAVSFFAMCISRISTRA